MHTPYSELELSIAVSPGGLLASTPQSYNLIAPFASASRFHCVSMIAVTMGHAVKWVVKTRVQL